MFVNTEFTVLEALKASYLTKELRNAVIDRQELRLKRFERLRGGCLAGDVNSGPTPIGDSYKHTPTK